MTESSKELANLSRIGKLAVEPGARGLDAEPHDLTGFNGIDRFLKGRHKRHEILEAVSAGDEDHDCDLEFFKILLKREVSIHRHEHVVPVRRKGEQVAIFLAGPASVRNGMDLVPSE